jgi:uncharacterized protein
MTLTGVVMDAVANQDAARELLIIFTRYPVPGQTKTRLIPVLGAVGAANLQRWMTERMVRLAALMPATVWICYCGGTIAQMQEWLGSWDMRWDMRSQGDGDLGERMANAFAAGFAAGFARVVIVGVDCPGLDESGILAAFAMLHDREVVFGPAIDGGYYLIGLRRFIPELFVAVDWGTERVLAQSVNHLSRLGLSFGQLEPLGDVDVAADLELVKFALDEIELT